MESLRVRLDDPVVDDAELLVSEIVSNSVRHAGLDTTDAIEVRIRGSRSMLHVDVIDPGPGFEPRRTPTREADRGWGLWLLDRLATRWGVERRGATRVWFDLAPRVSGDLASGRRGETERSRSRGTGGSSMGEKTDKAKGHMKETVGDLTDDEGLEREGKLDRMSGEVKGRAEDAKDKVEEGVDAVRDRMRDE